MTIIKVSDNLYRGNHPVEWSDFARLNSYEIKNILNLESGLYELFKADINHEIEMATKFYIDINHLQMSPIMPPSLEEIKTALAIIDQNKGNTFVHCYAGKDRCGTIIAAYRVTKQGWPVEKAMEEMVTMGHQWFLRWWDPIIRKNLEKLDVIGGNNV